MPAPWVGGVCSGVADHLGISVVPVRVATVSLSALGGIGVLVYMWLWLTLPTDKEVGRQQTSGSRSQRAKDEPKEAGGQSSQTNPFQTPLRAVGPDRSNQAVTGQLFVAGAIFLALGALLAASQALFGMSWTTILWVVLIVVGLVLAWMQAPRLAGARRFSVLAFVALGVGMVATGSVLLLSEYGALSQLGLGALVGVVVIAGVALTLVPLGIRVVADLGTSKAREARDSERAEIAAHLHDSVLQTLTLIRASADDPTRVRALALTQEGELRSWLYTGSARPDVSVAEALRSQALAVETSYGIAIDVVAVGDMEPGPAHQAAIAAAGEAMTNAVRHGAPPISVYQEVRDGLLEIYVKDSGPGFDVSSIPSDRYGFKNSIVGRVERVGGSVIVRSVTASQRQNMSEDDETDAEPDGGVRGGTEIRIRLPKEGGNVSVRQAELPSFDPDISSALERE